MEGAESRVGFIPFLLPAHVSHTLWVHRDPMDRGWATLTPWCPTGHISGVPQGTSPVSSWELGRPQRWAPPCCLLEAEDPWQECDPSTSALPGPGSPAGNPIPGLRAPEQPKFPPCSDLIPLSIPGATGGCGCWL